MIPKVADLTCIPRSYLAENPRLARLLTDLKTGTITGPHALPCRGFYVSCEAIGCIGLVFHVEHFVLANLYGQLYTYSRK